METSSTPRLDIKEQAFVDQVISSLDGRPGSLLGILEAVQEHNRHKYLPLETLTYIASRLDVPLSRVYSVATFYSLFNLDPQGDHTISICRGTACHTRGSRNLLERLRLELGIPEETDEGADKLCVTTPDGKFSLRTVACFGQCALAPVIAIDGIIYSNVTTSKLQLLVRRISKVRKNHENH